MIRSKQINDIIIEPLILPKKPKNVLGCELFPQLNANIFISASKNKGKTTIIWRLLEECADKDTHVIIFCGTVNNDDSWAEIKKRLQERKIRYSAYSSIYKGKINIVSVLTKALQGEEENEYEPQPKPKKGEPQVDLHQPLRKGPAIICHNDTVQKDGTIKQKPEQLIKKKKKKIAAPDYIIIFDDLSSELKDPAIPYLMKIQRHFTSKIIVSSQSYIDADSKIRQGNLDYLLLFKGIPAHVLEKIYQEQSISIPYEMFESLYSHATAEMYHFLYIDRNGSYRKDFNHAYELSE